MTIDAGVILSNHAAVLTYDQLTENSVIRTKQAIIDTLGSIFAGLNAPGISELIRLVKDWGGTEQSSLIATGDMYPLTNSVMVNAAMGRAMDIDDYHVPTGDHPSISSVVSALAVSEWHGGISGKTLITAIAVAEEVVLRIRMATTMGPWTTGTFAPFSSAIAAGKILGLNPEIMSNAFGLAFTECSSTRQPHREGVLAIRIHQGLAVKAGVMAVLLAKEGITGPLKALEGEFGFYQAFCGGEYHRPTLLNDLGSKFEIENVSIKPFPCCAMTHNAIEAALLLREEFKIPLNEIEKIIVYVNTDSLMTVGQPLSQKQQPISIMDAQFSIPYTLAHALVFGKVDMNSFSLTSIQDENVLKISRTVEVKIDPVYDQSSYAISPAHVEIYTIKGVVYTKKIEFVKGSPQNPMNWDELYHKYITCISYGLPFFNEKAATELFEYIYDLNELTNTQVLFDLIKKIK